MIRSTENQEKKFYIVSSSDWEAAVLAKDAVDASALGLEKAFEKYGSSLMLSNCITVTNASDIKNQEPEEMEIDIFYVPSVLADIGKNELAGSLDQILRDNQKKLDKQKMA
jgi:RecA/RadA recombinase|tara:strand:+ start:14417 stop:14749 length:333 start_codon:yes stop_codon:yes gene_type:complete